MSLAYAERRQIRDDLLHAEAMQKHAKFTAIKKEKVLDRLDVVSSISDQKAAAGDKVGV